MKKLLEIVNESSRTKVFLIGILAGMLLRTIVSLSWTYETSIINNITLKKQAQPTNLAD